MEVDVAVVGGGPAGAVTARCLASWGRSVAVFERSRYEEPRYGETLPPEAMPLLDALGLRSALEAVDTVESPGTVSSWGGDPVEDDFVRNVHGPGLHVDRAGFDRALASAAEEAGASMWTGVTVTGA
ncbi:MAG: FAD-dependent monooxygenase, partial [Actinomycetota bacterium]|nr:FAD-dependent monooxygenase [Actinomycetota bacterium]